MTPSPNINIPQWFVEDVTKINTRLSAEQFLTPNEVVNVWEKIIEVVKFQNKENEKQYEQELYFTPGH